MPLKKNIMTLRNPKHPILAADCSTYRGESREKKTLFNIGTT